MLLQDISLRPYISHLTQRIVPFVTTFLSMTILCYLSAVSYSTASTNSEKIFGHEVLIYDLEPDRRGGEGYKIVYRIYQAC